jgi:hypothetical protein
LLYERWSKPLLAWLVLSSFLLVGFQNCGSFATDPLLKATTGSSVSPGGGTNPSLDAPYTDGLAIGTTQTGALFARDPSSAAGDDRLSFSTDLSPYVVQTTIKHLDGSKSYLSDPYMRVDDDDFYSIYANPSAPLIFPQSDQRFQQVNAFFHADRLIAQLTGLSLFPGSSYSQIQIKAHCSVNSNAYFDTDARQLCLGYVNVSGKRVWAADDADVVTHEFGHSLNHLYAADPILYSSSEMGALDEAFADLWAYRASGDPRISVWFGRAILSPTGSGAFSGLRNLDTVVQYPGDAAYEVHDDSLFLSSVMKAVEADGQLNSSQMASFQKRLLESLQTGHGFSDVISVLQSEAANYGVTTAQVNSLLSARGLYRKDLASEISLDGTKPYYLIDNHGDTNLSTGNCNGVLDTNERALLFPNLKNSGALKGAISMTLVSNTTGVTVPNGGQYAFMYRMPSASSFLAGELSGYSTSQKSSSTSDYRYKLTEGSFYVQADSGFTGAASLTLNVKTMNTVDGTTQTVALPITLTVGSTATAASCSTSAEAAVYP